MAQNEFQENLQTQKTKSDQIQKSVTFIYTSNNNQKCNFRGAWVAQSVKCPNSTQVMIS